MSESWSLYIIVLTTVMTVGVIWVLLANRRGTGSVDKTTGHQHDGIEEYDNPLPAWWFYLFILSIVFGVAYLVFYPGMGNYPGLLNWTSVNKWEQENQKAEKTYAEIFARYRNISVDAIYKEPAAMKMAQRIFANNCAQCHGVDARGSLGFPNLADNDWLYGGSAEQISHSIEWGRTAVMPAWGQVLGDKGVIDTAHYVLSLSVASQEPSANKEPSANRKPLANKEPLANRKPLANKEPLANRKPLANLPNDSSRIEAGAQSYQTFCAACHGADAKGNPLLGAPNLTDDIWLYGGHLQAVMASIQKGRAGVMPAHAKKLNADKLHLLSGYVYGLSRRER